MIKKRGLAENDLSALKNCIAESKEKGFSKGLRKSNGKSPKKQKIGKHVVNRK